MATEPTSIYSGDSVTWSRVLDSYSADSNWVAKYELRGRTASGVAGDIINLTAVGTGTTHKITISTTDSAGWAAGNYGWVLYVEKTGERKTLDTGTIEIVAFAGAFNDTRSHSVKMVEMIESVLERKAGNDVLSYSVAGRALSKYSFEELRKMRDEYRMEVSRENAAEDRRKGKASRTKTKIKFTRSC